MALRDNPRLVCAADCEQLPVASHVTAQARAAMISNFIIVVLSTWGCENATYSKCNFALMTVTAIIYVTTKLCETSVPLQRPFPASIANESGMLDNDFLFRLHSADVVEKDNWDFPR